MVKKSTQKDNPDLYNDRIRLFLDLFAKEREDVRYQLAKDLPAYNLLLTLEAESFEDIALHLIAKPRGTFYYKDMPIIPACPFCNTDVHVKKVRTNSYKCSACDKMFAANHNSISSGSRCDALTWAKLIQCLLSFYGQTKTCEYCNISPSTYFSLRNKVFYAMQLFMDEVRLYGNIETDITFSRISYKGMDLQTFDFPEDSVFF